MPTVSKDYKPSDELIDELVEAGHNKDVLRKKWVGFVSQYQGKHYYSLDKVFKDYIVRNMASNIYANTPKLEDLKALKEANKGVSVRDKLKLE